MMGAKQFLKLNIATGRWAFKPIPSETYIVNTNMINML